MTKIRTKVVESVRLYYVYVEYFGFSDKTLNQDQIKALFEKLREDFLDDAIDVFDFSRVSGILLEKMENNVQKQDNVLQTKLEAGLTLEYYLPQMIKDKEWSRIGDLFKQIFE